MQRPIKISSNYFLILTENIPHNSTILHEIRCFFGSSDYLQNQSLVSKINRRTVKLMFESIWICYSSHCVSSLPLSKILSRLVYWQYINQTEHRKSIYNRISKVFATTIEERPSLRLSVCIFWLCERRCVYFFVQAQIDPTVRP